MFVSVLGLVPDMDRLVKHYVMRYDVALLEDTCESMGCEYKETLSLGTFGMMSTFFYISLDIIYQP